VTSWIDGTFANAEASAYTNVAPRNGMELCQIVPPSPTQIQQAVASSKRAFDTEWSTTSYNERGAILTEMANCIQKHQRDLIYWEAMDTGIPITQIQINHISFAITTLRYYAAICAAGGLPGRILDTPHTGGSRQSMGWTRREPLGVCVGIGAWNYPFMSMMCKLAPALACGNTMVYKPSECTPLSALLVQELWKQVLPPGVLQVLPGVVGQQIIESPLVSKVSLTGSVTTGINVATQAAKLLQKVTLELGGKSALLVFDDADLDSSVRVAMEGNFVNNGQVCSNCTRVFVENIVLDAFVERLIEYTSRVVVIGDNMDDTTNIGPMMMHPKQLSQHYDRVMGYIDRAKSNARLTLVYGGNGYQRNGAYFVEPTIFVSESDDTELVQEEIFGPVMVILPFLTEDEAIWRANNTTSYGLAAGAMTSNLQRAHRLTKQLQAGNVWINNWNLTPVELPFGPNKMSGYGRELGTEAMDDYSQIKTVYMEMGHVHESYNFLDKVEIEILPL